MVQVSYLFGSYCLFLIKIGLNLFSKCAFYWFIGKAVTDSMAGLRIQNNKVVQYPTISPTPAVSQTTKITPRPTIDADSGGTRIIPINVDPGYRPKSPNRAQANVVFGERYIFSYFIFHKI